MAKKKHKKRKVKGWSAAKKSAYKKAKRALINKFNRM